MKCCCTTQTHVVWHHGGLGSPSQPGVTTPVLTSSFRASAALVMILTFWPACVLKENIPVPGFINAHTMMYVVSEHTGALVTVWRSFDKSVYWHFPVKFLINVLDLFWDCVSLLWVQMGSLLQENVDVNIHRCFFIHTDGIRSAKVKQNHSSLNSKVQLEVFYISVSIVGNLPVINIRGGRKNLFQFRIAIIETNHSWIATQIDT